MSGAGGDVFGCYNSELRTPIDNYVYGGRGCLVLCKGMGKGEDEMINVGDKFKIQWERDNDSTSPWTLLLKEDGLWWALNHRGNTVAFNPLSSAISVIVLVKE